MPNLVSSDLNLLLSADAKLCFLARKKKEKEKSSSAAVVL
jgi:hypothetical protein